jgi:hypothetical protein
VTSGVVTPGRAAPPASSRPGGFFPSPGFHSGPVGEPNRGVAQLERGLNAADHECDPAGELRLSGAAVVRLADDEELAWSPPFQSSTLRLYPVLSLRVGLVHERLWFGLVGHAARIAGPGGEPTALRAGPAPRPWPRVRSRALTGTRDPRIRNRKDTTSGGSSQVSHACQLPGLRETAGNRTGARLRKAPLVRGFLMAIAFLRQKLAAGGAVFFRLFPEAFRTPPPGCRNYPCRWRIHSKRAPSSSMGRSAQFACFWVPSDSGVSFVRTTGTGPQEQRSWLRCAIFGVATWSIRVTLPPEPIWKVTTARPADTTEPQAARPTSGSRYRHYLGAGRDFSSPLGGQAAESPGGRAARLLFERMPLAAGSCGERRGGLGEDVGAAAEDERRMDVVLDSGQRRVLEVDLDFRPALHAESRRAFVGAAAEQRRDR